MNRVFRSAIVVALAAAASSCVSTSTSLSSTGEPLEVRIGTNTEKIQNRGTVYEPGQYQWLEGLYQGSQKIADELDFYHVAGDTEKEADIVKWRNEHNRGIVASWAGFGVGAGAVLGGVGYLFGSTGGDQAKIEALVSAPEGQLTLGAITAGGILLGAAPLLYSFLGPAQTIIVEFPDQGSWTYELVYPREAALKVAADYNTELTSTASAPAVTATDAPAAAPTTTLPPAAAASAAPQLTLARTTFKVGEEISVTFAQPVVAPAGQQYWLTLVAADAPDTEYGSWHYIAPRAGTDKLVAERAGTYEVRLHDLYPENKTRVLHRVRVVVK